MIPLNHCLEEHFQRRLNDSSAPRWLLFHDTDEYIVPLDTNITISQALDKHHATCCVRVRGGGITIANGWFEEVEPLL